MRSDNPGPDNSSPPVTSVEIAEQKIDLTSRTHSRVAVTISMEPGSIVDVSIQQLDRDNRPVSLEHKRFVHPLTSDVSIVSEKVVQPPFNKNEVMKKKPWQAWLIVAALVVYLATRFIGLDQYPIYFFTDEAIQTVLAADLVNDGFRDYQDELLPTYLVNGGQYNLGTSVYAQILPWMMFGKSIWVTRGTSVLITLLAALVVGLTMKNIFKSRYAFAAILFLSITPAWFLHSRTAFEVGIATAFYAAFLYCYLMYREGSPKYLFGAVTFGALCFYSYSPTQLVMAVTAVALLLSDIRTHIKNWKFILLGLGLAAVLAIPYLRFLSLHPGENIRHLEILDSYWIQTIPLTEKLGIYFKEYLKLLNPLYWFLPNGVDLERHVMKNYGHLLRWTIPFFVLGFGVAVRWIKKSPYRLLLIALLAAPSGSALAGAAVTRALMLVIPAVLLTALGLHQLITCIEKTRFPRWVLTAIVFLSLAGFNAFMLGDALVNGPTWYPNYTLGGQQYGASQVFSEIRKTLKEDPNTKIFLSPSWANGTDVLARFFFEEPLPFEMGSIDMYMFEKREIKPGMIFILIPEEMERVEESNKFANLQVVNIQNYPNGEPGFYWVTLEYADNIDQILAAEKAERQKQSTTEFADPAGRVWKVSYPTLDMGQIENLFDGDRTSLVRTFEANPMKLDILPASPLMLNEVTVRIGGTASTLVIEITPEDGSEAIVLNRILPESNDIRDIQFELPQPEKISAISISVLNTNDLEPSHVHVWEVKLE
jgi:hypothetical protein